MLRSSLLARGLGTMGIAALAWLPACSGEVSESAGGGGSGGDGGAGGEGTTTSGSEGGEGGGTTTTSGGCSPACDEHSACVEGQCEPVRIASFQAVHQRMYGQGGVFGEFAQVSACERPAGSPPYGTFEIVAEEGSCRALVYEPSGEEEGPIGLSAVVAKAPSFGTLTLGGDLEEGCLSASVPITPAYLDGETVSFEVAAGTHNAAFEIALESPAPLALTAGTITKGQPYEITWETGGPPLLAVLPGNDSVQIECTPAGGTSLVIPASLTALLDPGQSGVLVVGLRLGPESTVEISPTYRARAAGLRTELHEVTLIQDP